MLSQTIFKTIIALSIATLTIKNIAILISTVIHFESFLKDSILIKICNILR